MARCFVLLLPLLVVGCTPQARDDAMTAGADLGRQAAHKVADVAGEALKSAWDRASKLSPDSAADALESAKRSLEQAQTQLKPGERLEAARAEIERLRTAIDLQKLRQQADEKVAQAQEMKENAGKTVDDVREKLEAADKAYKDLQDRLNDAQHLYDEAAKKAEAAKEAVSNL